MGFCCTNVGYYHSELSYVAMYVCTANVHMHLGKHILHANGIKGLVSKQEK